MFVLILYLLMPLLLAILLVLMLLLLLSRYVEEAGGIGVREIRKEGGGWVL